MTYRRWLASVVFLASLHTAQPAATPRSEHTGASAPPAPLEHHAPPGGGSPATARGSDTTLALGVLLDREAAEPIGYTTKLIPFTAALDEPAPRAHDDGRRPQLEVVLAGPAGGRFVRRVDLDGLCLAHPADAPPHVQGDTIRLHRDGFRIDLPALDGFDRVEFAYYEGPATALTRRSLGTFSLVEMGPDLHPHPGPRAVPPGASAPSFEGSTVAWPEAFDDPDIYFVFGTEAEVAQRVNIVLVPDGYTYAEKHVLEQHAQQLVAYLRATTPYAEHDPFISYTLVYAYSLESGTDQCDCDIVVDTAMGTRFPEQVSQCGSSANRCLYYGAGCEASGVGNIVAAELRAPLQDETVVMVNTPRYGGCGGSRSVYSAANAGAADIAVHELGHSWAGLADEYGGSGCGVSAGEVNTSADPVTGAWPEWIDDLGPPVEGAQYHDQCLYRPEPSCEMRSLLQDFCAVCNQHWSLVTFGHPRVAPTAPVAGQVPPQAVAAWTGVPVDFEVLTRLSVGDRIENVFRWTLSSPGSPQTAVDHDTPQLTMGFAKPGTYSLTVHVVADANFVKPERFGANVGSATWTVEVAELPAPGEVSAPSAVTPLGFASPTVLDWEDASAAGVFGYNLYRGDLPVTGASYGDCAAAGLTQNTTSLVAEPAVGQGWFYLVTGVNPLGEGPLGHDSDGNPRPHTSPCQPG